MKSEYLLEKEVLRVLDLLTPSNRLVIRTCLHTGLRVSDVLRLRSDQLAPRFWITEQKTGKRRLVGLPGELLHDLKDHAGSVYVFPKRGCSKDHRSRQAVWNDVKRAARAYRLPQNVTPHSFRKYYAVTLLSKYGDLKRVQRALNHSSEALTLVYAMADMALSAKYRKKGKRA